MAKEQIKRVAVKILDSVLVAYFRVLKVPHPLVEF